MDGRCLLKRTYTIPFVKKAGSLVGMSLFLVFIIISLQYFGQCPCTIIFTSTESLFHIINLILTVYSFLKLSQAAAFCR